MRQSSIDAAPASRAGPRRFYVSTAATLPILALSPLIQDILGFSLGFPGSSYVLLGLSSFLFFFGGWPFLKGLFDELGERQPGMMTLIALTVGGATLAGWLIAGRDLQVSIARMATVMVITCPHAPGLAIPLVVAVSTSKSAQNGLLIRNRTAFENARRATTVLFDKIGTLTRRSFGVADALAHGEGYDEGRVLRLAATLEQDSEHPIGKGILARALERGVTLGELEDFEAIRGKGVEGRVDGRSAAVVSPGHLEEQGVSIPGGAEARAGLGTGAPGVA